jgi:hypothetical protein
MLNVNSTVNSTSDLSMENVSAMEERGIEDIIPFDDVYNSVISFHTNLIKYCYSIKFDRRCSQPRFPYARFISSLIKMRLILRAGPVCRHVGADLNLLCREALYLSLVTF